MKTTIIFALAIIFTNTIFAQSTQPGCYPYPRTISVIGSAEMEIIPDEIYVQVDLREYKKKGEEKKDIEKIKTEFLANCKSIGIADSNIAVASFDGYNLASIWRRKKRDPDLFASITYQLKFSSTKLIDELVNKLDDEATNNFFINRTSHSKIIEFRKQLKIMAVKAAKDKAIYLTESVNEQLGQAITITEPEETSSSDIRSNMYSNNANSNALFKSSESYSITDNGVDFRKIKIRFEVKILFALK